MTEHKRRDLANNTLQVCQRFYFTMDILSKDVSKEDCKYVYKAYENKINSLKVSLNEYKMLTPDLNNVLQEIVLNIKENNFEKCLNSMNSLEKELIQQIKKEGENEK